jgi:hypothetical protein
MLVFADGLRKDSSRFVQERRPGMVMVEPLVNAPVDKFEKQKHQLAAVFGGLALTIIVGNVLMALAPAVWLERPPVSNWVFCGGTLIVWTTFSGAVYWLFRSSWRKTAHATRPDQHASRLP